MKGIEVQQLKIPCSNSCKGKPEERFRENEQNMEHTFSLKWLINNSREAAALRMSQMQEIQQDFVHRQDTQALNKKQNAGT